MSEHKIPADWAWKPLSHLANIVSGGTPSRVNPAFWGGTIPWVTPSDITSRKGTYLTFTSEFITEAGLRGSSAKLLPKGSVLMTSRATLGQAKLAISDVCTNQGFKSLVPHEDVDGLFLLYQMQLHKDRYANYGTGTTFLEVNKKDTSSFEIPVPPTLAEQRRIATILSALDEQIEKTDALIEKLLLQRTGVVQQSLLPLAEEAEDYDLGTLASLVTSGSRGWGKYYSECGALFLRIGNLTREHPNLKLTDIVRVAVPAGGEGERTRIQKGDLLISITADLGVIGCIPSGFEEAYVNQHIALVRLESEKIHPRWVAHVLGSPYGAKQFLALNATGAKAGLTLPAVRRLRVPCPTLNKQQELVDILDSMDLAVESERRYLKKIRLQKAGLMRDLLTGKVRVSQ